MPAYRPVIQAPAEGTSLTQPWKVAHLTGVAASLRFLLLAQLRRVVANGGEVVGISAPDDHVPFLETQGIRHIPITSSTRRVNPWADIKSAVELWRVLRRERPFILHTHQPKPGLYGRIVGRVAGVPIVINTVHGLYATSSDPFWKRLFVYTLEALAARFSDAELVQSQEDYHLMLRLRLSPRGRAVLLGNGIDLVRFDPARVPAALRDRLRRDLRVGPQQILVGAVGRLVTEKGYPELFRAVQQLPTRYVLIVVGPEEPDKATALAPGLTDAATRAGIRFLGFRRDMDTLYSALDLLVLPSHREGMPRVLMEAAAMGIPAVATDVRGCREVVQNGVTGLLVPLGDITALADAMRLLGDNDDLRHRMGEAARLHAITHFDEEDVVDRVMELYRTLAAHRFERWGLELGPTATTESPIGLSDCR